MKSNPAVVLNTKWSLASLRKQSGGVVGHGAGWHFVICLALPIVIEHAETCMISFSPLLGLLFVRNIFALAL